MTNSAAITTNRVKSGLRKSLESARVAQLVEHLRTPLYRNGYALIFSSFSSAGLGVFFWMLAARLYSTESVGVNSAVLSSMIFLSNVAQFNLVNALNRFVPAAGRKTPHLVGYTYLFVAVMTIISGVVFLLGTSIWSPALSFLKTDALLGVWFVFAVGAWGLFVLQDSTLTGLRQAIWVPVENIFFAVLKIVLLGVFVIVVPAYGVFASWTVAAVATLVPVNYFIFRRLIPRHIRATEKHAVPFSLSDITGYVAGNYVGSLAWQAMISLLPIMVISRAGATANAYYYLSWTAAYSLYLMSRNMGMSLITEAATEPGKLMEYSRKVFAQTARMLVPVVAVMVIGAPLILRLFGSDYASEAPAVFRLLALSAIPHTVITLYLSIARIKNSIRMIVFIQFLVSFSSLALGYVLLDPYGITGIGIALLATQTIIAVALLLTDLRAVWLNDWTIQVAVRWLAIPRRLWWYGARRGHIQAVYRLFDAIKAAIPAPADLPPPKSWRPEKLLWTLSDVTVVRVGPEGSSPVALLKAPQSKAGAASLRQQMATLDGLRADSRLDGWKALLPTVLFQGEVNGQYYVIERELPGIDGRRVMAHPATRKPLLHAAAASIAEFHRQTGASLTVDAATLARWIDKRIAPLRAIYEGREDAKAHAGAIDRLAGELRGALDGRQVAAGWIHGDFTPGNILATADGAQITGILDWDQCSPMQPPQIDTVQLLIATRMIAEGTELGHVVNEMVDRANWMPDELELFAKDSTVADSHRLEPRTVVLLAWLQHVSANLEKSERYQRHRFWLDRNVETVLEHVYPKDAHAAPPTKRTGARKRVQTLVLRLGLQRKGR